MTEANIDRAHRSFVSYIDKSRAYYAAHGYETPYKWAYFDDVPFTPIAKPLSECRVGVVTTASLYDDDTPDDFPPRMPKQVFTWPTTSPPRRFFTDDLAWHKKATHTDDVGTFLPIDALRTLREHGRIGSVAPRFYGAPTEYSQRRTGIDAGMIEGWCRDDQVAVVMLVPL